MPEEIKKYVNAKLEVINLETGENIFRSCPDFPEAKSVENIHDCISLILTYGPRYIFGNQLSGRFIYRSGSNHTTIKTRMRTAVGYFSINFEIFGFNHEEADEIYEAIMHSIAVNPPLYKK